MRSGTLNAMEVTFVPADRGGSVAVIVRDDGVRLRMWSYDRTFAVPHDLVHFVTERTFGLRSGVWGSIADGAIFDSMEVVAGRLRHDSRQRSRSLLTANQRELGLAELLTGVVHQSLRHNNAATLAREITKAWGTRRESPCPYTPTQARAAVAELAALADQWRVTTVDRGLTLSWPSRRAGVSRSTSSRFGSSKR